MITYTSDVQVQLRYNRPSTITLQYSSLTPHRLALILRALEDLPRTTIRTTIVDSDVARHFIRKYLLDEYGIHTEE